MKNLFPIVALIAIVTFFSCKPAAKEEAEEPIPSSDFKIVLIKHAVDSFERWLPHYEAHDSMRMAYGLEHGLLGRGMEDPDMVLIVLNASDMDRAKEFIAMPELKTVMDTAGVVSAPQIDYIHVIRFDSTADLTDRVLISHKVKDFDAWLKVYDAEGRKVRASHGLVDRALGRGIDDPNMVYIALGVTDMEKAKARSSSEELKGIMTEAGVVGPPEAFWYKVVD